MRKLIFVICCLAGLVSLTNGQPAKKTQEGLFVKGILKQASPIFSDPSSSSGTVENLPQYSFVFLFDEERNGFARVGTDPTQPPTGWIPTDRLREWNHRICIHFTPLVGRQPALVYKDEGVAEEVLRGAVSARDANGAPHPDALAEEPGDLAGNRYSMILPVLDVKNILTNGRPERTFNIGFLSGGLSAGPAPSAPSQPRPASSGNRLAAVIEIMFVIDATASMGEYIDATKEVVSSLADRATTLIESGISVGVMAYRDRIVNPTQDHINGDYKWGEPEAIKVFSPLTSNIRDVQQKLDQIKAANASSEETEEMGYDALMKAITEIEWNKTESSLRLVVWVGDASAHEPGSVKNPLNISKEQLLKIASDNRMRFGNIKIQGNASADESTHIQQMQALATGITSGDPGFYTYVGNDQLLNYRQELIKELEEELRVLSRLTDVTSGNTNVNNVSAQGTGYTQAQVKAIILKNLKMTSGSASPTPEFSEGWINEKDENGAPFVNNYVYMSRSDLELTKDYLKIITNGMSAGSSISLALEQVLENQTGDEIDPTDDLSNHYSKRFALPVTSRLLKFSLAEIDNWGDARKQQLAEQIGAKAKLLEKFFDDPANWFSVGSSSYRYTFVPIDFFP